VCVCVCVCVYGKCQLDRSVFREHHLVRCARGRSLRLRVAFWKTLDQGRDRCAVCSLPFRNRDPRAKFALRAFRGGLDGCLHSFAANDPPKGGTRCATIQASGLLAGLYVHAQAPKFAWKGPRAFVVKTAVVR
jgi:hypothetical protein